MVETIDIHLEAQRFFISINMKGAHSFVMCGVYRGHKVEHMLCRVGKFGLPNGSKSYADSFQSVCKALFSTVKGTLVDEGLRGNGAISYQAYEITYDQYVEFAHLLESLQPKQGPFLFYKPLEKKGQVVTLQLTRRDVFSTHQEQHELKQQMSTLNAFHNSCRHTAIQLVQQVPKVPVQTFISSQFFYQLPYSTTLCKGKPTEKVPFYVLPVPPAAVVGIEGPKRVILEKLYVRMEAMAQLAPEAKETIKKFEALKTLYLNIAGPQKESSFLQLLQSIQSWREQNKPILETLRQTFFWDNFVVRQSKTMKLVEEIEQCLQFQSTCC